MRTNQLGSTGLIVSELCLGAMTFGDNGGRFGAVAGLDQPASTALVSQAVDAGINFPTGNFKPHHDAALLHLVAQLDPEVMPRVPSPAKSPAGCLALTTALLPHCSPTSGMSQNPASQTGWVLARIAQGLTVLPELHKLA